MGKQTNAPSFSLLQTSYDSYCADEAHYNTSSTTTTMLIQTCVVVLDCCSIKSTASNPEKIAPGTPSWWFTSCASPAKKTLSSNGRLIASRTDGSMLDVSSKDRTRRKGELRTRQKESYGQGTGERREEKRRGEGREESSNLNRRITHCLVRCV